MLNKKDIKKIGKGILISSLIILGTTGVYATNTSLKAYIDNFRLNVSESELSKLVDGFFDSEGYIKNDFIKDNSITSDKLDKNYQLDINGACPSGKTIQEIKDDGTIICAASSSDNLGNHTATSDLNMNNNNIISANNIKAKSIEEDGTLLSNKYLGKNQKAISTFNSDKLEGHDANYFQKNITGNCEIGKAISEIKDDGTIICTTAGGGNGLAPYLSNLSRTSLSLNTSQIVEVNGGNFDLNTTFELNNNNNAEITNITILSDKRADLTIKTKSEESNIIITAKNGIKNNFGSNLAFDIVNGPQPIEKILSNFKNYSGEIAKEITNQYSFIDGITGYRINDGGNDMYDGANQLYTNLKSNIEYSNNLITNTEYFGSNTKYFTSKESSLFLMVADLNNIDYFKIYGNLGADGQGNYNNAILSQGGYKAYISRVYNAHDPSINHMIIISDTINATQSIYPGTQYEDHKISGLNNAKRIYYLLFAKASGAYVDNTEMSKIFTSFINNVIKK